MLGQGGDNGIHLFADIGRGFCGARNLGDFGRQICRSNKWEIGQHHRLMKF